MFAFKILGLNNSVFPEVQELMLQISRELMKTCRGRLTTCIPLHWAGGWAVPSTAGMCWCFAKAMMNPVPSEAFSWRDRGGQAILEPILWSSQSSGMGCWSWHSCLPPKREREHQVKDVSIYPNQKEPQWECFTISCPSCSPFMTIYLSNILDG